MTIMFTAETDNMYTEPSDIALPMDTMHISAEKQPVKSGGWLAKFQAFDGEPKYAAFTTASAAKQWLVDQFNEFAGDERKRLPWKKESDLKFTAHAEMSARGKINFKKS